MPEHREGTPAEYVLLESFLWRDFETPAEWDAWVRARGLTPDADADDVVADAADTFALAMRLRGALRALAAANPGGRHSGPPSPRTDAPVAALGDVHVAAAVETLNHLIAEFGVRPVVAGGGRVALRGTPPVPAAGPVAVVLTLALEAMRADVWRRFKLCPEPSCGASFYDASKNATKTWCAMATCGSRNKMRRLRARQRR